MNDPETNPFSFLVLPDRQTAEMCLRFAALERKLGEIDRARAIYAHASQFCDPRTNQKFWSEWNSFEIETGSEDTFREMLRIKRSVQAQFNTEASYLTAQTVGALNGNANGAGGGGSGADSEDESGGDAMANAERAAAANGPAFVAAKSTALPRMDQDGNVDAEETAAAVAPAPVANVDEIHISDDEDI
jgi:pre-mRNA-splicing factor SYF1